MINNTAGKELKRGWQRAQESVGLMWRNRYGRLLLLAPCLFIFLTLLWSPSVHPGLSVNIKAHTQTPTDTHKPMHVSWDSTPVKHAGSTIGAKADAFVIVAAAPAAASSQHIESAQPKPSQPHSSKLGNKSSKESSVVVLQQHLQNATAKSVATATEALSLIQPALGLQPNFTANSSLLHRSSASSQAEPEDVSASSQVHMGFNHTIIHDSSESDDHASVNSTDVISISEMPHEKFDIPDRSADWAQTFEPDASDRDSPPSESMRPDSNASSASSIASTASAAQTSDDSAGLDNQQDTVMLSEETILALQKDDDASEQPSMFASQQPTASSETGNTPDTRIAESARAEAANAEALRAEAAPHEEVASADESAWVHVDPYSDDLQGMIHPTSRMFRAPGKFPVTRADLVAAMPTDERHFPIVQASKAWRKDMRTYVALSNETVAAAHMGTSESQEIWGYWPDDEPLKGLHPGDTRAALTPFLAHEAFKGEYKWILYGDDDTFFFVDGVLELLQDFDPSLPYFITDHYWWGDEKNESMNYHPHERAPRCLPCHWSQEDEERSLRADGYRPFQPYVGCPCTAEVICKTDDRGFFGDACEMPLWKPDSEGRDFRVYTMHGGAGALMSIGLMERLPLSFMDKCMSEMSRSSGGDALISVCLWKAGFGFTDPGYSFYHWEAKYFDPGPENSNGLLSYLEAAMSNTADQYSLELLSHVATSHLRSHNLGVGGTTQTMEKLASMYDMWRQRLQTMIVTAQTHASQHQKVLPMIQSTTGIGNWKR